MIELVASTSEPIAIDENTKSAIRARIKRTPRSGGGSCSCSLGRDRSLRPIIVFIFVFLIDGRRPCCCRRRRLSLWRTCYWAFSSSRCRLGFSWWRLSRSRFCFLILLLLGLRRSKCSIWL